MTSRTIATPIMPRKLRPVHAEENRVAVQVEDGERHEPTRKLDIPFQRFLQVGQDEIGGHDAQHGAIAQASGQGIDQAHGNQCRRKHAEAGGEQSALVDIQIGELRTNGENEPGQDRSQQNHEDIRAEAFQQDPWSRLRGAENQFQPPVFQVRRPLQGQGQRKDHDQRGHEREDQGTQQRGIGVGGGVEKESVAARGFAALPG